jgi:hypothetical protein
MDYIGEKLGKTSCQHCWEKWQGPAVTLSLVDPNTGSIQTAGHPSAEVRGRALESLEFKWKYGLISVEDLLQVWITAAGAHMKAVAASQHNTHNSLAEKHQRQQHPYTVQQLRLFVYAQSSSSNSFL